MRPRQPQGGGAYQPPPPPGPPPQPRPQQPTYPPRQPPYPPPPQSGPPPTPRDQATTRLSTQPQSKYPPVKPKRRFFRDPASIVLILVIAVALVVAALIGAELYARHLAESKVAAAVGCEVQDKASVSFGVTPPLLWQFITSHYTNISVQTAGNQIRDAKGMKVSIDIQDVRLANTNNSKGTIGALNGTITWSSDGIKQSIQNAIPVLGSFVTSKVTTNPNDGTIELNGLLDSATVKPQIVDNGLSLQVISLSALGSKLSTDKVQQNLDSLTSAATKNYPLGIHADSVKVTNTGVEATFSTQNATIPSGGGGQDPCFANV